ncbi:DUF6279 family lipoprotein [Marinobacter sp.]|uniref:DUF6279 family lipoprotein n=1 Tax=Marinobacter sp. TaxID=50741 RepID=UPI0035C72591
MDFHNHQRSLHTRICLLFSFVAVLTTGCSSTKLAYRYADWGIVWWVEDYISLTDQQRQRLNADLENLRQWHCSAELPRYQDWLGELQTDVAEGVPSRSAVVRHQERLFGFVAPTLERTTPVAANLLESLSDEQVRELARNMERGQREREEEYLADTRSATAEARADRTTERVERWLGTLNAEQRQIVEDWSENRGAQTEIWLEGRRNWQQALLTLLEERNQPDFRERLRQLIVNSEQARGQAYQAMMAESRAAMAGLIHDLIRAGDTTTLAHLQDRATELKNDFAVLECEPA